MLCICVFCVAFFGLLVSAMPTIVTFIFMRFLEGYGVGGLIVTGYVLLVEYCGVKQREFVTPIYHVNFNVGHMVLPGISYLLRNFIHFQIAVSLPVFLFVFLYCSVYESPKWLMDSGQIDKAAAIMTKIAK